MMKNRPPLQIPHSASSRGSALVIVLSFVVLLLVVVMAYFSKSLLGRQIAKSSAGSSLVQHFADGAVNTVIGDLRAEIQAGSTATNIVTGSVTNTIYYPTAATNMVPALAGSSGTNGLENLVKISSSTAAFYSGATTRAAASSSTNASANGRYISPVRWNKPLLLARQNTNSTTDFTPTNSFVAPEWIYVARNGSNPTAWNANLCWSETNNSTVIGRYAYAIYDEGGILDANVAGYPTSMANATASYKSATAFADLTQIGLSTTQINALVGWRNYATGNATGSYPSYTFPDSGTNFSKAILSNTNGFLKTANTDLNGTKSDRMFTSRQTLIEFLKNADPSNVPVGLNALRYLGTFSRALEQPSFAPDPNRPKVVNGNGGNTAYGGDDNINPAFLSVRVASTFTRNDGTAAVLGEPLVKKRFALNRLAWLTYAGPITLNGATYNPALANSYVSALKNTYGFSDAFLLQGTPANIYKYFGLNWVTDTASTNRVPGDGQQKWLYDHSKANPASGVNSSPVTALGTGGIVQTIQTLGSFREPDFFELLKAGIACGSKAKAGVAPQKSPPDSSVPTDYYYKIDSSLEFAILQIGANIIDQFDLDGFPTRIVYYDAALPAQELRGIENMPYLYGVRQSAVQGRAPTGTTGSTGVITDTGYLVYLQQPTVWNPHDSASPRCAKDSAGSYLTDNAGNPLFPTTFRCVADTQSPDNIDPSGAGSGIYWKASCSQRKEPYMPFGIIAGNASATNTLVVAPFTSVSGIVPTVFNANRFKWSSNNTAMQFTVNDKSDTSASSYFREPTILLHSSVAGGSLQAAGPTNVMVPSNSSASTVPNQTQAGDLKAIAGALTSDGVRCSADGNYYMGMFMAVQPAAWAYAVTYNGTLYTGTTLDPGLGGMMDMNHSFENYSMTFRMQYQTGTSWATYDTKFFGCYSNGSTNYFAFIPGGIQTIVDGGIVGRFGAQAYDPRTGRFYPPAINSPKRDTVSFTPDTTWPNSGWLDSGNTIVPSTRPDSCSGYTAVTAVWGTLPLFVNGWTPNTGTSNPGMVSQNIAGIAPTAKTWTSGSNNTVGNTYYADPDGVVRKAAGAYANSSTTGLPLAMAYTSGTTATSQVQSRPIVLNRPFRTVGELGYVFSGTPWKNIDFFTQESGDCPLLDVLCITEPSDSSGLVAGKVNLNTRQIPVLQAILLGGYKDEQASLSSPPAWKLSSLTAIEATSIVGALVNRTTSTASGRGPLVNVADLVGRYVSGNGSTAVYSGLSNDLSTIFGANTASSNIPRFRDAPIRALAASGQTRAWNLLIDVVAQTGRYPQTAQNLDSFMVEGEQRYWVHVAIDRFTGKVIDKQVEVVKE
jgi:Tfp pilus assembly protein PilX